LREIADWAFLQIVAKELAPRVTYFKRCRTYAAVFSSLILFALCTGCFVLTGDRCYKPDLPPEEVQLHETSEPFRYSARVDSSNFLMEIAVENGPPRWQAPFWFYVIPIPSTYGYLTAQRLQVHLDLTPKSEQVAFAPSQVLVIRTNQSQVPPSGTWYNGSWFQTNAPKELAITNRSRFLLNFSPWDEAYTDRSLPFQLDIGSITVSGRTNRVPRLTFRQKGFVRAGWQLPY
jgi:hypothetical protein